MEEKIKELFLSAVELYCDIRNQMGMPIDKKKFTDFISECSFIIEYDEDNDYSFQVSQYDKTIRANSYSFKKNGREKNILFILHEFTHLSSEFKTKVLAKKAETIGDTSKLLIEWKEKYQAILDAEKGSNDISLSSWDATYGLLGIDEAVAQWTAEEINDIVKGQKRKKKKEKHSILGNEVEVETDFSFHDIYAPLQGYVEHYAKKLGFKSFKEFAVDITTGKVDLFDLINEDNITELAYIGIICQGIYQENGFAKCGLPETDIQKAIRYFENIKDRPTNPEAPTDPNDGDIDY